MGVAVWLVAGGAAFLVARIVPAGRRTLADALAAHVGAAGAGQAATALDFGGWAELDWRAAVLGFVTALLLVAVTRITLPCGKSSDTTTPEAHS